MIEKYDRFICKCIVSFRPNIMRKRYFHLSVKLNAFSKALIGARPNITLLSHNWCAARMNPGKTVAW